MDKLQFILYLLLNYQSTFYSTYAREGHYMHQQTKILLKSVRVFEIS